MNMRWDLIASNAAADALLGLSAREPGERNMMRLVFADPALRRRLPDWHQDAETKKLREEARKPQGGEGGRPGGQRSTGSAAHLPGAQYLPTGRPGAYRALWERSHRQPGAR